MPKREVDDYYNNIGISNEHYDDEGTYWFTADNGKRIGIKKGQNLEQALDDSGIPDDGKDYSDVTASDIANQEDDDSDGDGYKMVDNSISLDDKLTKVVDRFWDNNYFWNHQTDSYNPVVDKINKITDVDKWDMKELTPKQRQQLHGVDKQEILDRLKQKIASKDKWRKDEDTRKNKQAKQDKIDSRKQKKNQRELEKHEKEVEQRLEKRENDITENPELMEGRTRDAINQLNRKQKERIEDLAREYQKDNYYDSRGEREDIANVIDVMDDYGTLDDYTDKELGLVLFFATTRMKNNLDNYDKKDQRLYSKMMDIYNDSEEAKITDDDLKIRESYYGYGSATGRMSPAESWNQMYLGGDVWTGAREIDPELRSLIREFEGLQWSELPADIQELWKQMGNYRPSGESKTSNCPFNPNGENHEFIKDENSDVTCKHCGEEVTDYEVKLWGEATEEFKEEEHPRDGDGQFTSKGGGSTKDDERTSASGYKKWKHKLVKQYSKDPEGVAKTLEDANEDRDLVKDGHLIVTTKYNRETREDERVIEPIKPYSLSYPEAPRNEGYSSELVLNDFKIYSNFKGKNELVSVGDEIEFRDRTRGGGEIITNVLVTGFSYDGDEWEGASAVGYVTYSSDHDEHPIMREKGHGNHRMSDATRIVSRGGIEMKNAGGEVKANELSPEAPCPKCGSYKTILEDKSSLGYGKRRQYVCLNCYNIFQSEYSPKEIKAMYRDGTSPYDRNRYWGESKATEQQFVKSSQVFKNYNYPDGLTRNEITGLPLKSAQCKICGQELTIDNDIFAEKHLEDEHGFKIVYGESKYTIEDDFDESDQNDGEIQEKYVRGYENDWKDKLDTCDGRAVSDNFTTVQPYDPVNPKYECIYCGKEFSWDDTFTHDGSHGTLPHPFED